MGRQPILLSRSSRATASTGVSGAAVMAGERTSAATGSSSARPAASARCRSRSERTPRSRPPSRMGRWRKRPRRSTAWARRIGIWGVPVTGRRVMISCASIAAQSRTASAERCIRGNPEAARRASGSGSAGRRAGWYWSGPTEMEPPPATPPPPPPVDPGAAAAVAAVRSGQRVFVHGGAAVPRALLAALVARAGPASCGTWSWSTCTPWARPPTRRRSWPAASATGPCSSAPTCARRCRPGGRTSCPSSSRTSRTSSAPGACPWTWPCSTSPRRTPTASAPWAPRWTWPRRRPSRRATVIAQLNPAVPRSLGDSFVHAGRFHATLAVDEPPAEEAPAAPGRGGGGHRGPRGRAGGGRGDPAAGHRGHPQRRARRPAGPPRPGGAHGDVQRRGGRPGAGRGDHRGPQAGPPGQGGGLVRRRHRAARTPSCTTTPGWSCTPATTPTTPP